MSNHTVDPSWMQEFDSRIKNFSEAIEVSEDNVRKCFNNLGISGKDEKSLLILEDKDSLPISDLFEAFVDSGLTKKSLIRFGMKFLLPKNSSDKNENIVSNSSIEKLIQQHIPKSSFSDFDLLSKYDQNDLDIYLLNGTIYQCCHLMLAILY